MAESIINGESDCGILCCGTGIGISIASNKVMGIRVAVVGDVFSARLCKEHNNANCKKSVNIYRDKKIYEILGKQKNINKSKNLCKKAHIRKLKQIINWRYDNIPSLTVGE